MFDLLVVFWKGRELHAKALSFLLDESERKQTDGSLDLEDYLKWLCLHDIELTFEYARKILEFNLEKGLQVIPTFSIY